MPRKREFSADDAVEILRDLDKPFATTGDIADGMSVTEQTVRNNANHLESHEKIRKGKVARSSVYWLADAPKPPEIDVPDVEPQPGQQPESTVADTSGGAEPVATDKGAQEPEGLVDVVIRRMVAVSVVGAAVWIVVAFGAWQAPAVDVAKLTAVVLSWQVFTLGLILIRSYRSEIAARIPQLRGNGETA